MVNNSPSALPSDREILAWLELIASESFFDQLAAAHKLRVRKRIYPWSVVVALMVMQRLQAPGTLASVVQYFAHQVSSGGARSKRRTAGKSSQSTPKRARCNRARKSPVSTATGAYCQARKRMPTLVASQVNVHIFEQLWSRVQTTASESIFMVDGSTLQLEHEPDLVEKLPPGHNQHGDNHWPMLLIVAFHDTRTGLATQPVWGPKYGPNAASETGLARQALDRLPLEALVLADSNFGIFAFGHAVQHSGRRMVLRLTVSRANAITRGILPPLGTHRKVVWSASRWDRKKHPDLPTDAQLQGWVVAARNPSKRTEKMYFFTTVDPDSTDILELYKERWNIETDLRALKRTVHLHHIYSRSVEMVEKELLMAVSAYNLVRAIQFLAAERAGIAPRELSFATVQAAVLAALPHFHRAASAEELQERMELLLYYAGRATLPQRKRKRSYPREVWGRGGSFPSRQPKSEPAKEKQR